jgi:CHAT domain-containing protein
MKKYEFFFHVIFRRLSIILFSCFPAFLSVFVIVFQFSCVEKKMSIEEAKKVAVAMEKGSFVPPPRRIDDILAVLDQTGQFDPEIVARTKAKADAFPPETDNHVTLANFYLERGLMARELGRAKQCNEDIKTAWIYATNSKGQRAPKMSKRDFARILVQFGQEEVYLGNFKRGISLIKQSLDNHKIGTAYRRLAQFHFKIGDFNSGKAATNVGINFLNKKIAMNRVNYGSVINKHLMRAELLHYEGRFAEEELERRSFLKKIDHYTEFKKNHPRIYIYGISWLARSLARQGRLVEAELEARRGLNAALGHAGNKSAVTARTIGVLGEIILSQGRVKDSEKLARARVRIYEDVGASQDSLLMGEAIKLWGQAAVARYDFTEAMKRFDLAKENLRDNRYAYTKYLAHDSDVILCLLKAGRVEEALKSINSVYIEYEQFFGKSSYPSAEMLSLRGMANAMMGMSQEAMRDFSESVPILLAERTADQSNYLKKQRLMIILETYLDLLTEIYEGGLESEFRVNASAEIFKLVQAMIGSSVQSALGASGARAAAVDPELANLVRREQDALNQVNAFQKSISNAISAPLDLHNPNVIKDLQVRIEALNIARATLMNEIKRRFPKYSDFTNPQPVTFFHAQNFLRPGEVLIFIYTANTKTYVWAIPHRERVRFSASSLGRKKLCQIIDSVRAALDSEPVMIGDIPEFDLAQAYDLYIELFKRVEKGWKNATDLLIVANGPLDQLPFSILPTSLVRPGRETGELFSNYRKVPWLIRKFSITRLPSASSFVTLRILPKGDPLRRAFVGFGDPVFNSDQLAQMKKEKAGQKLILSSEAGSLHVRGIRITETGNLDSEKIGSCQLDSLNRLPDTAEEIKSIAEALNADLTKDIFIGEKASEHQVKTMDLSNRRVIAFASHALVPGDLDGLDQPALALSSPSVTGENEDGLLTMGEILKLKLNADWVVLSACNTGAADGAGAEAASGLGRAFFYAGTRAILVSLWPVETTSARNLTTGLFRFQKEDKKISRARALRKSMLELIDGPGLKDNDTGKIVASYAHPLFWAPFIVVGESGRYTN